MIFPRSVIREDLKPLYGNIALWRKFYSQAGMDKDFFCFRTRRSSPNLTRISARPRRPHLVLRKRCSCFLLSKTSLSVSSLPPTTAMLPRYWCLDHNSTPHLRTLISLNPFTPDCKQKSRPFYLAEPRSINANGRLAYWSSIPCRGLQHTRKPGPTSEDPPTTLDPLLVVPSNGARSKGTSGPRLLP